MALPKQLKSARMTNSTLASAIDDNMNQLEADLADILGLPLDTDITAPVGANCDFSLVTPQADKNNSLAELVVCSRQLAAGALNHLGQLLRVTAGGTWHNTSGSNVNFTIAVKLSTDGTLTGDKGPILLANPVTTATGISGAAWGVAATAATVTTGASGKLRGRQGTLGLGSSTSLFGPNAWNFDTTSADLSTALWVIVTVTMSAASPNAGLLADFFSIERIAASATA